jgi:L-lactate dehydrogenase complex protein LldG
MNSRNLILSRIREAQPAPRALPEMPMFDANLPLAVEAFRDSLARLGGVWCEPPEDGDVGKLIRERFHDAPVVCSRCRKWRGRAASKKCRGPTICTTSMWAWCALPSQLRKQDLSG